jgi:hypothetical protein
MQSEEQKLVIGLDGLILSAVIGLALILGLLCINSGIPYFPQRDAEPEFMARAGKIAALNHLSPGWFGHPGSTLIYPLALTYKLWSAISSNRSPLERNNVVFSILKQDPAKAEHFEHLAEWAEYARVGRLLNLLFYAIGIWMTYLVGKQVWGKREGLLSAWFMATSPILLIHAHIIRTDHVGLLFLMVGFLACFRLLSTRTWLDYAIAGLAIGVAGSSRYFNLSLGAVLILAHILAGAHTEPGHFKRLFIGLVAIVGGFLITTPAFIFSLNTVYKNLTLEARGPAAEGISASLSLPERVWWYLSVALPKALSWPIYLLAIVAVALSWRASNKKAVLLVGGFSLFLLTISVPRLYWDRWIIPVVPIALLFATKAMWAMVDFVAQHRPMPIRWEKPAAVTLIILLSVVPLYRTLRHVYRTNLPDTRTLATEWVQQNIPPGARIARERFTPFIPDAAHSIKFTVHLHQLGDYDSLSKEYDYVIVSNRNYEGYFELAELHPEKVEFYRELFKNELVAEFKPGRRVVGPVISIYRLPQKVASSSEGLAYP